MSCSKPLPPFTFELLCYLNRGQLERFSIICRPLKNLIDRYFHSKPYRIFDGLQIRGGSCFLFHNNVNWHPNLGNYTAQQFLDGQKCNIDNLLNGPTYYSFAKMLPYLGATVRIKWVSISVAKSITYNAELVAEMESIAYLWRNGNIQLPSQFGLDSNLAGSIIAGNLQPILNSSTILQCQTLYLNVVFSFKDYKVLYAVNVIQIYHYVEDENDLWDQYWQQFLEHPGDKPIVIFHFLDSEDVDKLLDQLSKDFSSAVSPNAFKIVFAQDDEPLTEFRKTNKTSGEKLELKKGLLIEYQKENLKDYDNYTLERSNI